MTITGTVRYQDFEGGFWGIESDDSRRFLPVDGVPRAMQVDGCRIVADIEPANMASIQMWGQTVRLLDIRRAEPE